ncbi:hypothetical protein Bhyg_07941 [Pseudolycoriella hygida]|uniref:Uncharacterized protein n=1 Tax=Pseudolycoriella hygida TaxID=35572 RepID=A0A9Q0S4B3_9DIPT|nr:hypothetical protein Bhyg_07941 [Pseudolycoriella hygida]
MQFSRFFGNKTNICYGRGYLMFENITEFDRFELDHKKDNFEEIKRVRSTKAFFKILMNLLTLAGGEIFSKLCSNELQRTGIGNVFEIGRPDVDLVIDTSCFPSRISGGRSIKDVIGDSRK